MKTELSRECDQAFLKLPPQVKRWLNEKSMKVQTSCNITMGKIVLSDYREYIEKNKKSILSFSGGKDSTCLLLMMLEKGMKLDYILFCDTGEEFPELYEHVEKVEKYISEKYGKHITRLKRDRTFEDYLLRYKKTKGGYEDTLGKGWSSFKNRWCTKELKTIPIRKFMQEHGLTKANTKQYIGIAADEPKRVHDDIYPLFEWGITERQALQYCYEHGFYWGGLYEYSDRLSCWLCPLQSIASLKSLYIHHRKLWEKLKKMDDQVIANGHKWRYRQFHEGDLTLTQWEERFKREIEYEKREMSLF